jgi:hypothetical protein
MYLGISERPTSIGIFKWRWLGIKTGKFAKKHEERLLHHVKVEAIHLLDNSELVWRLKKKLFSWCSGH